MLYVKALIPQPLLPEGEEETDSKSLSPRGEGFRVRAKTTAPNMDVVYYVSAPKL